MLRISANYGNNTYNKTTKREISHAQGGNRPCRAASEGRCFVGASLGAGGGRGAHLLMEEACEVDFFLFLDLKKSTSHKIQPNCKRVDSDDLARCPYETLAGKQ